MTRTELLDIIVQSDRSDWEVIPCNDDYGPSYLETISISERQDPKCKIQEIKAHNSIASYSNDLSITIAWGMILKKDYQDDFTKKFPNKESFLCNLDIFYNRALVHRIQFVVVDGGRSNFPLTNIVDDNHYYTSISEKEIKIINLLNELESGDDVSGFYSGHFSKYKK